MQPLYEKYRPRAWSDVIGQEKTLRRLDLMRKRSELAGRAYWLSGQSGTGKTTIARLIAAEAAEEWAIEEIDATALTPAEIRRLEERYSSPLLGAKRGAAILVNEAHGLRRDAIKQLLVALERIPAHVVWIFTTTNEGQENLFEEQIDANPLLSRCIELPLSRRGLAEAFAARVQEIARAEGLDGKPLKDYVRLLQECRNNFRRALQAVESGAMFD